MLPLADVFAAVMAGLIFGAIAMWLANRPTPSPPAPTTYTEIVFDGAQADSYNDASFAGAAFTGSMSASDEADFNGASFSSGAFASGASFNGASDAALDGAFAWVSGMVSG